MKWPLVFLLAAAPPVLAGVQEVWWNLTYVENANPDGLQPRRVIGVNGTWPPPPLDVNSSDSLVVHTLNSLDEPSTLHHHGMFFNSTSWMDGAMGLSQCGIPPGQSFDYVVPINSSGQWGTYWVHSHYKGQYVDGLRAPVVIHPQAEKYSYDAEFTVVLGDWYHQQQQVLLNQFISIANPGGAEPIPVRLRLLVQPGKTYRLRIVNTSAFAAFYFWIDGHDMRIIEADGVDVAESPIDLVSVTVAQRYSVLVTARNDTSANWAIHANMDTVMFDTVPATLNPSTSFAKCTYFLPLTTACVDITSSVTYSSSAPLTDLGTVDAYHDVDDLALVPLDVEALLPAGRTIELEVSFDTMEDGTNHAMFNMVTYNSPLVPAIMSMMSLGDNATVVNAYGPNSFVVDHLETFDIVVKNGDAGKHPFHLHGHKMQLVGRSQDYTSDNSTLNPPLNESQPNPMRRDTVQVPSMNSVTLRVVADNPGAWFFHCHIEWHLEVGLAVEIIEAPLIAQERNGIPQTLYDQCSTLGFPTSGNAAGHASTTDLSGLPVGPFPQNNGWHSRGIGAMAGCVLTAVIGMATVVWYALGGYVSEEEMEHEARLHQEEKERRGRFFGLIKRKA
ncbi:Iron transport multicopper oxidase fio1 [Grifola frondosa]|uniref:Iron transport multicopper oxidase fio1 n=1 Tax=Grifola frondosa TaxID=5627 RepID=A0A1C7MLZ7_GRIFR|nr:Iron transport multicopper oxidase fio1 [Grifola frondosa]